MQITFENVTHIYQSSGPLSATGIKNVNLTINDGDFVAIIGQTGSGKSTLVQHMNALLKPTAGVIHIGEWTITPDSKNKHLKKLRQKVGMVFQFPEAQLFEDTVLKDICFGPQNFGASLTQAQAIARGMLDLVKLPADIAEQSPFDLSGGQMRRVAIAGVLAARPQVLILDEPTAGLDPQAHIELMELFANLNRQGTTIILISHQMEDLAQYCNRVLIMENAQLIRSTTPQVLFNDQDFIAQHNLQVPEATAFAQELVQRGFQFESLPITEPQLVQQLRRQLGGING